jgi:methionine-rich copper-binding protein CopC
MTSPTIAAVRRPARSTCRRHRLAALAAAALVLVAPVALAAPASAHDSLTGSTPEGGSTVTTAPERVRLTFTDEVKELGLTVLVKDPSGASVADGEPRIDGNAVIQPVVALTEPGTYTVAYRVVSSDGHPINGRFTFTLDVAEASSPAASPSATPTESPSESASASASATPSAATSTIAASPAASTSDSGGATTWLLVGAGLLVALVVTGVALARRRSA